MFVWPTLTSDRPALSCRSLPCWSWTLWRKGNCIRQLPVVGPSLLKDSVAVVVVVAAAAVVVVLVVVVAVIVVVIVVVLNCILYFFI